MITPEKLLESAKELETQLRTWRRTLHRHPEVGFDLPETKALVKKALTEMGYAPQDCGKCGVLALAGGKRPGKTISHRYTMEAVPNHEQTRDQYPSDIPAPARPSCCAVTWMLCPFRKNLFISLLPRSRAGCTAAATICTPP